MIRQTLEAVAARVRTAGVPATVDVQSPPQEPGPAAVVVDDEWTPTAALDPVCGRVWSGVLQVIMLAGGWDREQLDALRDAVDRVVAALAPDLTPATVRLEPAFDRPAYVLRIEQETT